MCYVIIKETFGGIDDVFFQQFRAFPKAEIPKEPDNFFEFKLKLEPVLILANDLNVDIFIEDDNGQRRVKFNTMQEFEQNYQILEEIEHTGTSDLPETGNYWAISKSPFIFHEVDSSDVYDNPEDGDILNLDISQKFELPNSRFNHAHSKGKISIIDRLSKYGESFPFLNEDGKLTPAALADIDELLMSEATDAELIGFIKDGFAGVERLGNMVKDGVKSTANAVSKGVKSVSDHAKNSHERKLEKSRDALQRELEKEEIKATKGITKRIKAANQKLDDVDPEKAAKAAIEGDKDSKAIKAKNDALSAGRKVIADAKDAGFSANSTKAKVKTVQRDFKEAKKELKDAKSKDE